VRSFKGAQAPKKGENMRITQLITKQSMIESIAAHRAKTTGADYNASVKELKKLTYRQLIALDGEIFTYLSAKLGRVPEMEEYLAHVTL
jgi:hypothetical protein